MGCERVAWQAHGRHRGSKAKCSFTTGLVQSLSQVLLLVLGKKLSLGPMTCFSKDKMRGFVNHSELACKLLEWSKGRRTAQLSCSLAMSLLDYSIS